MKRTNSLRETVKSAVQSSKKKKKDVGYSLGMKNSRCGKCEYFNVGKTLTEGTCDKVKGIINAEMWCELFEEKSH